jgi:hypothetical protein
MKCVRMAVTPAVTCVALFIGAAVTRADVRTDEKTNVEFAGMLGRMVNLFGGRGAREGVASTVALKGERKAIRNESTSQIVDLGEEKIYDLDMKKKTYTVTTFAELRRQMEEARKKAEDDARRQQAETREPAGERPAENAPPEKEVEVDFNIRNTGEKKTINGFETSQAVMTIALREKGRTLEQSGGLVLTADMWLAPRIAAVKEIAEFDAKYAQRLYGPMVTGVSASQMAAALAMYPMMKDAIARMSTETEKLEGTPILTTTTLDAVKSEAQVAEEASQKQPPASESKMPTSVGGLLGGLGRKAAAKKMGADEPPKSRATFMAMTTELLKVVPDVTAADVGIPAGFKEAR